MRSKVEWTLGLEIRKLSVYFSLMAGFLQFLSSALGWCRRQPWRIKQWVDNWVCRCSLAAYLSVEQFVSKSVSLPVGKSLFYTSVCREIHESLRQTFFQSMHQTVCRSISQRVYNSFIQSISTLINKQKNLPVGFDGCWRTVELSTWPICPILPCDLSSVHCEARTP